MKFLADRMLGKLAKKLRLLGFDTLYFSEGEEDELLKIVSREGRILLTRDRDFYEKAVKSGVNVFLLKSDKWRSQLRAIFDRFKIRSEDLSLFSRCTECNGILDEVDKEMIKDRVPEYVYLTHDEFKMCRNCGRVYWRGTHVDRMIDELSEFLDGEVSFEDEG